MLKNNKYYFDIVDVIKFHVFFKYCILIRIILQVHIIKSKFKWNTYTSNLKKSFQDSNIAYSICKI